jgi:hypothetical protein
MYSATEGKALTPSDFREYVGVEPPPQVRLTERSLSIRNGYFESGSDVSDRSLRSEFGLDSKKKISQEK